jgi:hypothetical protein
MHQGSKVRKTCTCMTADLARGNSTSRCTLCVYAKKKSQICFLSIVASLQLSTEVPCTAKFSLQQGGNFNLAFFVLTN